MLNFCSPVIWNLNFPNLIVLGFETRQELSRILFKEVHVFVIPISFFQKYPGSFKKITSSKQIVQECERLVFTFSHQPISATAHGASMLLLLLRGASMLLLLLRGRASRRSPPLSRFLFLDSGKSTVAYLVLSHSSSDSLNHFMLLLQ